MAPQVSVVNESMDALAWVAAMGTGSPLREAEAYVRYMIRRSAHVT